MPRDALVGRWLAAGSFAAIGFGCILTGHLPLGLIPIRTPVPSLLAGLLGAGFGALALLAATGRVRHVASIAAAFPAVAMLLVHIPRLVTEYRDPLLWSSLLQMMALMAGVLSTDSTDSTDFTDGHLRHLRNLWILLWCGALVGFGVQHFMYPAFIAGLIPEWIPARLPLAWLTGIAFEAAALSFLMRRYDLLAGRLLALMWTSWVAILHIPRISAQPDLEAGWTSGFIALGLGGVALVLAGRSAELPSAFRPVPGGAPIAA